jgi:hypothetical protein
MIRLSYLKSVNILTLSLLLFSCQSEYEKLEKRELASGKQVNELFLGLKLGMDQKTFFETCWELNKQGKLTNGPSELSVEYMMPIEFTYEAWAPWNEDLSAEKLREDVVKLFEEWYGPGFIEVTNEDKSQIVFVKMDGNRRIRIFKKHISTVRAEISDLPTEKKLKENSNS